MSEVTRDEFNMLRDQVKANAERISAIDQGGTRGVAVVGVQVTEVIKDVADVRAELRADVAELRDTLERHNDRHDQENRSRLAGRRWALGFAAAAAASVVTIVSLLINIAQHLH